ncbi:hypothetical protein IMCC1909_19590 [Rhodobacteraceae bacterium IMCC1909]|nr:hypothetical protein [Rhodobacteraceae bacterium IMCC1909]
MFSTVKIVTSSLLLYVMASLPLLASSHNIFEIRSINRDGTFKSRWDQEYASEQLYAVIDSVDYLIAPTHEKWMGISLEVIHEGDLDGDGLIDAVISSHQGGNCCAPYYFVVSHRGDGFFSVHHHESMYGHEIEVKNQGEEHLIEILDAVGSSDYPIEHEELTTLKFTEGNLEMVSQLINTALIPALVEVTGQDVKEADKLILFDVDEDGRAEEMIASYWDRWGTVIIGDIVTTSKGKVTFSTGCSRIGFMKTTTNGLHDIVCGRNDVLKYDLENNRYK